MLALAESHPDEYIALDFIAEQPAHLQPFFSAYSDYIAKHNWLSVQDFYNLVMVPSLLQESADTLND